MPTNTNGSNRSDRSNRSTSSPSALNRPFRRIDPRRRLSSLFSTDRSNPERYAWAPPLPGDPNSRYFPSYQHAGSGVGIGIGTQRDFDWRLIPRDPLGLNSANPHGGDDGDDDRAAELLADAFLASRGALERMERLDAWTPAAPAAAFAPQGIEALRAEMQRATLELEELEESTQRSNRAAESRHASGNHLEPPEEEEEEEKEEEDYDEAYGTVEADEEDDEDEHEREVDEEEAMERLAAAVHAPHALRRAAVSARGRKRKSLSYGEIFSDIITAVGKVELEKKKSVACDICLERWEWVTPGDVRRVAPEKAVMFNNEGEWKNEATKVCKEPSKLPCGHFFGKRCLANWLLRKDTCPCCRTEVDMGNSASRYSSGLEVLRFIYKYDDLDEAEWAEVVRTFRGSPHFMEEEGYPRT